MLEWPQRAALARLLGSIKRMMIGAVCVCVCVCVWLSTWRRLLGRGAAAAKASSSGAPPPQPPQPPTTTTRAHNNLTIIMFITRRNCEWRRAKLAPVSNLRRASSSACSSTNVCVYILDQANELQTSERASERVLPADSLCRTSGRRRRYFIRLLARFARAPTNKRPTTRAELVAPASAAAHLAPLAKQQHLKTNHRRATATAAASTAAASCRGAGG